MKNLANTKGVYIAETVKLQSSEFLTETSATIEGGNIVTVYSVPRA
jgi:hypothetical protein